MRYILSIFLFALLTVSASAADYYVCNTTENTGSDSNDGSLASPWLTFDKAFAEFKTMAAGSTLHFCDGGEWTVSTAVAYPGWTNTNCNSNANRCTITKYTPSGTAVEDVDVKPNFIATFTGDTLFYATTASASYFTISNIQANTSDSSNVFFWAPQYTSDIYIDNVYVDGFGNCAMWTPDNGNENGRITNSEFYNAINCFFGGTNNLVIDNNIFKWIGSNSGGGHAIYLAGGSDDGGISNVRITNNQMLETDNGGEAGGGNCGTVVFVAHGQVYDTYVAGNLLENTVGASNPTCWGIAFDIGYTLDDRVENFDNWVIEQNRLIGLGGPAISCSSCTNTVIRLNYIEQSSTVNIGVSTESKVEQAGYPSSDMIVERNIFNLIDAEDTTDRLYGVKAIIPGLEIRDNIFLFGETPEDCALHGSDTILDGNVCLVGTTTVNTDYRDGS